MNKITLSAFIVFITIAITACSSDANDSNSGASFSKNTTYLLQKYYRDPNSPAALMMGSMYAGSIGSFNVLENCKKMKAKVESDDRKMGYTNSRFVCEKK